jgi:hypothetical protein
VSGNGIGTSGLGGANIFADPAAALNNIRQPILGLDTRHGGFGSIYRGLPYWNVDMSMRKMSKMIGFVLPLASSSEADREGHDRGRRLRQQTGDAVFDDTLKTALTVALNQSVVFSVRGQDSGTEVPRSHEYRLREL